MNQFNKTTTVRLPYLQSLCAVLEARGGYDEEVQWMTKNYIQPHNGTSSIETEAIPYFTKMSPLNRRLHLEYPDYTKDVQHEMEEREGDMAGNDDGIDINSHALKEESINALTVDDLTTGPYDNEVPSLDHLVAPSQHKLPDNGSVEGEYQEIAMYQSFLERNPEKRKRILFANYHEMVKSIRADFENAKKYRKLGGRRTEGNADYFLSNSFTKKVSTETRARVTSKKLPTTLLGSPKNISLHVQQDELHSPEAHWMMRTQLDVDVGDKMQMGNEVDMDQGIALTDYPRGSTPKNISDEVTAFADIVMMEEGVPEIEDGAREKDLDLDSLKIPEGVPRAEYIAEIKQLHEAGMWNPTA